MDPKIIDDIRDRRTPHFDDPKGQMIYDVAKSLHEGHGVSKALYDEAVKLLGERGLVEIIGLCGYYTMVSMTLNTFEFELPDGRSFRAGVIELDSSLPLPLLRGEVIRSTPQTGDMHDMPETSQCPSSRERASGMFISRWPISIARWDFIAACSDSSSCSG